jgi:hypothetical protein
MHPYQRGRALNAGLRLELREIIEAGRLVGVAWRVLLAVYLFLFGGDAITALPLNAVGGIKVEPGSYTDIGLPLKD